MADTSQKTSPKRKSSQIETNSQSEYSDTAPANVETFKVGAEPTKIKLRSQQTFMHHLFKAAVAKMHKNVSWVKNSPKFVEVEHVHFFHTKNSMGMAQEYTNEIGGHFHKIEWGVDAKGNPVAKCGPALKKVNKRGRGGLMTTINKAVSWVDKYDDESEEKTIIDDHTHEMEYLGTDELSTVRPSQNSVFASPDMAPKMPVNAQGDREIDLQDMSRDA